jgi:hypothetical protein
MKRKREIIARFRRWPAITLSALFVALVVLWIDSFFHIRTFIFLPGGDCGLGFYSEKGLVYWVEYTPWAFDHKLFYSRQWHIPYWVLVSPIAALLCWHVLRKTKPVTEQIVAAE